MRRMPFSADMLDLISQHMVFNKETNTMELGVNVEIDGNAQVNDLTKMQLFYSGEIEDATAEAQYNGSVYVLPLYQDEEYPYQYGLLYMQIQNNQTFVGIGYWNTADKGFEVSGTSDLSDTLIHVSASMSGSRLSYFYEYYQREFNYYQHELEITLANNTKIYLNYPSKNNLVIDSLQDLSAVVKPMTDTKLGYGSGYIYRDGQVWKNSDGTLITSVKDNVEVID